MWPGLAIDSNRGPAGGEIGGRCGEQVKAGEKGANRRGTTRPGHQVVRTAESPHTHQNLALRTQA